MIRQLKDKSQWHHWFALLPVTTVDNKLVWCQMVQRRQIYVGYAIDCCDSGRPYFMEYKTID